jgi:hypothetical protein
MSYSIRVTDDFNEWFLPFCQRHELLPFEGLQMLAQVAAQPDLGIPVSHLLPELSVFPLLLGPKGVDYLICFVRRREGVVLMVNITHLDLTVEQGTLQSNMVSLFRLLRAGRRILEWFDRILS